MTIFRQKIPFLELPYTLENIKKYKSKDNLLRHARFIPGKTKGVFFVEPITNSLIGYCGWDGDWIIALEVAKEFQKEGFGEKLLDKAISLGCTKLTVNNKNSVAISLYKKKGFRTTSTDGRITVMELN